MSKVLAKVLAIHVDFVVNIGWLSAKDFFKATEF